MEVTNKNFKETLPLIQDVISKSSFLAIDTEFTGLGNTGVQALDTPEERYHKLRLNSMDFLVVQFGLCAFEYDETNESYIARTFNFYIFPKSFSRQAPDTRFLCQSSSMHFLISQGFDFNKLFKEGISYLGPLDHQKLKDALEQKHQQQMEMQQTSPAFTSPMGDHLAIAKGPPIIPDEHKEFIENVCNKIEAFQTTEEESLRLKPCNAYLRKLIYQTATLRFRSSIHLETKTSENKERYIVVTQVKGEEDLKKKESAKRLAEMEELDDAVGFSKVINMISQSGKLVVGHNMILDVLHTLNRYRSQLPEEYEDFKALTRCVFPRILDTKLMASTQPFREPIYNTTLGDLQKILEIKPFTKPQVVDAEDFPGYSTGTSKEHEAGYDAYITGLCFISMANFLGTFQKPAENRIAPDSPLLAPFINKLFLLRVQDVPYINLAGPDLLPSRDHVFHVIFPKEWKAFDLSRLFSPFGGIQIAWLDENSAFVSLYQKDQADSVIKTLGQGDCYKVMTYYDFLEKKKAAPSASTPSSQTLKRKMPSSDIDLPYKRKRSSEGSPFASNHSIPPILEEDETMEDATEDQKDVDDKNGTSKPEQEEEDIGVPVAAKRKKKKVPTATLR